VWSGPSSGGGWQRQRRSGGGLDADPASIRFLKERGAGPSRLYAVAFRSRSGRGCFWLAGVEEGPDGRWAVAGGAGGGLADPPSERPWLNLCGWGWPRRLRAGGRVVGRGSEAARRARLTLADGRVLEDTVDDRVVLFAQDSGDSTPVTVEILDGTGGTLSSHPAFGGRRRPGHNETAPGRA
jgi:hypothetical protein